MTLNIEPDTVVHEGSEENRKENLNQNGWTEKRHDLKMKKNCEQLDSQFQSGTDKISQDTESFRYS
jgi:hypothetical protein